MIDLAYYTYILLNNHECVVIPGLGGFITRKKSALIHATQNLFIPPSKHLIFNGQLVHNDGLLAHLIARDNAISYETAIHRVENAVNDLLFRLYKGDSVSFENIGTLTCRNGLLKFEAAQGQDIQDESYGLNSFMMPLLQAEKYRPVRTKAPRKSVKPYQAAAVTTFLVLGLATTFFHTTSVQDYMQSNIMPKVFHIMMNASGTSETTPTASGTAPVDNNAIAATPDAGTYLSEHLLMQPENLFIVPAHTNDPIPEVLPEAPVVENSDVVVADDAVSEAVPSLLNPEEGRYYIIIGSFQKFSLADKLYKEVTEKGYHKVEILDIPGSSYRRVSLQSFDTYREAKKCLDEVQDEMQVDAWIMKGKSHKKSQETNG